ncbi:hypothetical protein BOSP111201_10260 [Bordetella sputigena]|uniref:hypothetical protein n=1 Tax=Bordetella sputigena TaxID=1416810 RepID=UPI0039EF1183
MPIPQEPLIETPNSLSADGSFTPRNINWREEFSVAGGFLRDHWALLGVAGLVLSAVAMQGYLIQEAIPLSIVSQEVVACLPVLFILIVMAVVSLGGAIMFPTAVLVGRQNEASPSVLDEILRRAGHAKRRQQWARVRLLAWWILGLVVPSGLVAWMFQLPVLSNAASFLLVAVSAVILFAAGAIAVVWVTLPHTWHQHVKKRWGTFLLCGFFQMMFTMSLATIWATRFFSGQTAKLFMLFVGAMAVLGIVQMTIAWATWEVARGPRVILRAMSMAGVVMSAVCLMPPFSHFLVGYVMQSSATGGRGCTVFTWTSTADVLDDLRQDGRGARSVKLQIPMATPTVYFVRPWDGTWNKDVAPISLGNVAKVSGCAK